MKVFSSLQELRGFRGGRTAAVTIGNFDGCHLGHQALCRELTSRFSGTKTVTVALTFDPHPAVALGFQGRIERLQTLTDRLDSLARFGNLEATVVLKFDETLARTVSDQFVREFILGHCGAEFVAVGTDFRFGAKRQGDVVQLEAFGRELGFVTRIVEPVKVDGETVSSTLVRRSISELGDFSKVETLLARPWFFRGRVVHGRKLGRTLGFPTANLDIGDIVMARQGVYAGWAELSGKRYPIVMNVGLRPTVENQSSLKKIEVHLLEPPGADFYGEELTVQPKVLIRSEMKFLNVGELAAQIRLDCEDARRVLAADLE